MQPMLATPVATPPAGPDWVHEVKWDGMRVLADVHAGRCRLRTRTGADAADRFPELARLTTVIDDALLDGEVVSLAGGVPSFARLADRIHAAPARAGHLARSHPVTFVVFDLLRVGGHDVTDRPWHERRALLDRLAWPDRHVLTPPVHDDGATLLHVTAQRGLEGVVSKRRDAPYAPGRRSGDWLKCAHRPTRSVVVGGWRPEQGSARGLGALLVGVPDGPGLRFLGRVGSGLAGRAGEGLLPRLREHDAATCPFSPSPPTADVRGTRWVDPVVVVDVRSLGLAGRGRLRQPSYHGPRTDLAPADVVDPAAADPATEPDEVLLERRPPR